MRALNAAVFNQDLGKTLNPEDRTILPPVAFTSYRGRFEEPKIEEGFTDVMKVDFEVCCCSISFLTFELYANCISVRRHGRTEGRLVQVLDMMYAGMAQVLHLEEFLPILAYSRFPMLSLLSLVG